MPNHTAYDAAKLLGIHDSRVRQLARQFGIGQRFGRSWLFTDEDVEKLRQRKTLPGPLPGPNARKRKRKDPGED